MDVKGLMASKSIKGSKSSHNVNKNYQRYFQWCYLQLLILSHWLKLSSGSKRLIVSLHYPPDLVFFKNRLKEEKENSDFKNVAHHLPLLRVPVCTSRSR